MNIACVESEIHLSLKNNPKYNFFALASKLSSLKNENQASTHKTYSISCFVHMADTEYTVG